jgi:hypothetical protein
VTWYVSLVIALSMGTVRPIGYKHQPTIVGANINGTSGVSSHERFWASLFRHTENVAVVTTNYDILPERGLWHVPRPRVSRPEFHYGSGTEMLAGSGYPSFSNVRPIKAGGRIPLLRLHGSVSWSLEHGRIVHHIGCEPAIQGKAVIVAPVTGKSVPSYVTSIWDKAADALSRSDTWIVIGYSFPTYDETVNGLFVANARHAPHVPILNPDRGVAVRVQHVLPTVAVSSHPGIPDGIDDVLAIFGRAI